MKKEFAFHQWSVSDLEKHFETDQNMGLSEEKAAFRLQKEGKNSLLKLKENSPYQIFFRQFANFFVIILAIAAIISYFVDGLTQSIILFVIAFLNVALGFFQEYKAEKALAELKETFRSQSKVLRGGKTRITNSENLVSGDIILLEAGDKVPADARIIDEESLRVNESALTGESLPVSKNARVLPLETPLGDRSNTVFGSTIILAGHAKAMVVATGERSEFGHIAGLVEGAEEKTPLEKQILYLGKILTVIAFLLASVIFFLGYFRHFEILELLTFTIALLVAIVPESLPTAITLSLSIGVSRMAAKKAIVRRMAVVETLGTINVIATDKTGTITDNNLSVDKVIAFSGGKFTAISLDQPKENKKIATQLLSYGLAVSNIDLNKSEEFVGDPIEVAIVEGGESIDNLANFKAMRYTRLMEVPFDSDKKYMAVMVASHGQKALIVKGMPEKVIGFCHIAKKDREMAIKQAELLSAEGYKVIALARRELGKLSSSAISRLDFLGFFAIVDSPSAGIKEAIKKTISAGIRPLIITGDHPETARYVAEEIGLKIADDEIIVGEELSKMSKASLVRSLSKVKIFARVTPEDKIELVRLLQQHGYSVAMTGDGVNDAPALKEAQVGIAMGIKGTDIARESADIILSNDKYGTVISAIEYGRTIYDNIRNTIIALLPGNFDEVLLIGTAFVFGLPVPLTALQILWLNLITESLLVLSLSFEHPSRNILKEAPRSIADNSLKRPIIYAALLAFFSFLLSMGLFLWGLNHSISLARTLVFCFLVLLSLTYIFSIRSKKRIWQSPKSFIENKFLLAAGAITLLLQVALFAEPLRPIFKIELLNSGEAIVLIIFTVAAFFIAELIRFIMDRPKRAL